MSSILVVYGTTHGHTAKVAGAVAKTLEASGASCDVIAAAEGTRSPADYDGVVVAASVHAGKYQRAVTHWVRAHRAVLDTRPTAFISVCLGVLQKDPKVERDLNGILDRFFSETGWRPHVTTIVAGALAYTKYNWFIRWTMKRIAAKPAATPTPRATTSTPTGGRSRHSPLNSATGSRHARAASDRLRPSAASPHLVRVSGIGAG